MRKRIASLFGWAALVVLGNVALAAEQRGEAVFDSFSKAVLGGTWTTTSATGERVEHTYYLAGSDRFLRNEMKGGPMPGMAVVGVDPESKLCMWTSFLADGSVVKGTLTGEGQNTWALTAGGDGPTRFTVRVSLVDKDTIKEEESEFVVAGQEQEVGTFYWKRQADDKEAFEAYADLAVGGVWQCEIDGEVFEDRYERILDGRLVQMKRKAAGGFAAATSILGIDPVTGKFTWWGFNADGKVSTGTMWKTSDNMWMGESIGKSPKGSDRAKGRLTKVDADTIKYEVLEQQVEGEAKAFPTVTVWKRKR